MRDDRLADDIEADWRTAGLSDRRMAILEYAVKLTATPGDMSESDLGPLRANGLSDRDILDVVEVTAYYAYANRIADGLGVELEGWYADGS